jgi:uncharacterized protein YodC (DUF2158 family)
MATGFNPGDVVRVKGDDREMTVEERKSDEQVRCVRFTEVGTPVTNSFDVSKLELVWKGERKPVLFRTGDVVQLPSAGPFEYMTVEQGNQGKIRCLWFSTSGLVARWFAADILWMTRPTDDAIAQVDTGDHVILRSGGPSMTVVQGGAFQVGCLYDSGGPVWFDARTLMIDVIETGEMAALELIAFAQQKGVDLMSICHSSSFLHEERYISFWRKTRVGVIYYSTQGSIKLLPEEFRESASAFYGMWHEAGYFDNLEQTFAFFKAWILDHQEVDELPKRCRSRYGIG